MCLCAVIITMCLLPLEKTKLYVKLNRHKSYKTSALRICWRCVTAMLSRKVKLRIGMLWFRILLIFWFWTQWMIRRLLDASWRDHQTPKHAHWVLQSLHWSLLWISMMWVLVLWMFFLFDHLSFKWLFVCDVCVCVTGSSPWSEKTLSWLWANSGRIFI